jgi:hypothetical protein
MSKPYEQMTREEREQMEADWRREHPSTAETAMTNIFASGSPAALPSDFVDSNGRVIRSQLPVDERERRDREIMDCMKGVVADARRSNPVTGLDPLPTVTPAGAGRVAGVPSNNGWRDPGPLQPAGGAMAQALIEGLTNAFQPHGSGNKERRGKK